MCVCVCVCVCKGVCVCVCVTSVWVLTNCLLGNCLSTGDVSPISMSPISQSQFIPLGEILCLAISAMNSARKPVTQEALMEHLTTCFPGNGKRVIYFPNGCALWPPWDFIWTLHPMIKFNRKKKSLCQNQPVTFLSSTIKNQGISVTSKIICHLQL